MAHAYHSVLPITQQTAFQEHDVIDFLITAGSGRVLQNNSISLDFEVEVYTTAQTRPDGSLSNELCVKNGSVFFNSVRTEVQKLGQLENLLNYNRYCNMVEITSSCKSDICDSSKQMEGVTSLRSQAYINSQQEATQNTGTSILQNKTFSIKPKIAMNKVQPGSGEYSFDKYGHIKLSLTLERSIKALFGLYSETADSSYVLKKVVCRYETIPMALKKQAPLLTKSYQSIKTTVNSQNNMLQAQVPSKNCSGLIISFIDQGEETLLATDSQSCQVLNGISGLRFLFDSNLGERVAYQLEDVDEMNKQACNVLSNNMNNQITRQNMASNKSFLLGLDFMQFLDITQVNVQVEINLKSSYSGTNKNAYLYFMEDIQL